MGSLRPTDVQYGEAGRLPKTSMSRYTYIFAGDGQSYLDDAPETPAPVFAVRAFKTALFGTPHPERETGRSAQAVAKDAANEHLIVPEKTKKDVNTGSISRPENRHGAALLLDPLASPTKGILITPGTAATRRKTVSFGFNEAVAEAKSKTAAVDVAEPNIDPMLTPHKQESEAPTSDQPRHSKLTKQLIKLSKQKSDRCSPPKNLHSQPPAIVHAPTLTFQTDSLMVDPDTTVDLSQPRSRSGQHWKAEFEEFHKRSSREMKKVIQYGQNVRSYAVIKDHEATTLSEKLEDELAKVAAMETKVSKLSKRLSIAQAQGPEGDSDQTRLVSELAQQTARAIRYKQKADRYKAAIQKRGPEEDLIDKWDDRDDYQADTSGNEGVQGQKGPPDASGHRPDRAGLRSELKDLRETARAAEDQAARLETENSALKRSLARVKEEMMSYDTRRQAREEHLKKRETKHKAAREEAEARLAKLIFEHEELLRATGQQPQVKSGLVPEPVDVNDIVKGPSEDQTLAEGVPAQNTAEARSDNDRNQARTHSISPRKRRLQEKTAVDIWTFSSPKDAAQNQTSAEPTEIAPSSVKHDIKRTLREISDNLVPDQVPKTTLETKSPLQKLQLVPNGPAQVTSQPSTHPAMRSATRRMHPHRTAISSPRPSMINLASSPAKLGPWQQQPAQQWHTRPSQASVGRSASIMSRVGGRTSTIGSVRGSALSTERAAAARARLAKRCVEKKKREEGQA